jgi:hypothetical protein
LSPAHPNLVRITSTASRPMKAEQLLKWNLIRHKHGQPIKLRFSSRRVVSCAAVDFEFEYKLVKAAPGID